MTLLGTPISDFAQTALQNYLRSANRGHHRGDARAFISRKVGHLASRWRGGPAGEPNVAWGDAAAEVGAKMAGFRHLGHLSTKLGQLGQLGSQLGQLADPQA